MGKLIYFLKQIKLKLIIYKINLVKICINEKLTQLKLALRLNIKYVSSFKDTKSAERVSEIVQEDVYEKPEIDDVYTEQLISETQVLVIYFLM